MNDYDRRFIEAFDAVAERDGVSMGRLCDSIGMLRPNLAHLRHGRGRHVQVEWMDALCRLGVSADWLLTGAGEMFNNKNTKS